MNLFLYVDCDTWLHRLDPRTKIIAALVLFALCLVFNHPLFMAAIAGVMLAFAASARALPNYRKMRFLFALLFLFSALLWPLFVKGPTVLWSYGSVQVSRESLLYGAAMGLRLVTFVGTGLLLLSVTRHEEIINGLIRMGLPYPIAFAAATALRLVPTFAGAGATIIQAQVSRGLDLESGSIFRRFARSLPQAVPLFIFAVRQTNYLGMALESRGFSPSSPRTLYREPKMRVTDWMVILVVFLCFILLLYVRLGLHFGAIIPGRL